MTKEINPQRTFIEQFLPVKEISKEAKKEKSGRPPTFKAHYWWSRKPLIVMKAVILGSLLPCTFDREEFNELLGLGRKRRAPIGDSYCIVSSTYLEFPLCSPRGEMIQGITKPVHSTDCCYVYWDMELSVILESEIEDILREKNFTGLRYQNPKKKRG